MDNKTKVPMVAGLAVLGAVVGVQLGQSAVAEINPAYFSSPEPRFHADLVPNAGRNWEQVQFAELQQAAASDGYGDGCVRCPEFPTDYVPEPHPAFDGFEDDWSASAPVVETVEAVVVETPDPNRERLARYASFPVNERQARRAREAADAAIAMQEAQMASADVYVEAPEPEPEPEPVYEVYEVYAGTR